MNDAMQELIEKAKSIVFDNTNMLILVSVLVGFVSLFLFTNYRCGCNVFAESESLSCAHTAAGSDGTVDSNSGFFVVDISGAVVNPGVYELEESERLVSAVNKAGGFDSEASLDFVSKNINLSKKVTDEKKLYIPYKWDVATCEGTEIVPLIGISETENLSADVTVGVEDAYSGGSNVPPSEVPNTILINVNSASNEELQTLNGIGPKYAQKIVENRPYEDVVDFESKADIPAATIEKIADLITYK